MRYQFSSLLACWGLLVLPSCLTSAVVFLGSSILYLVCLTGLLSFVRCAQKLKKEVVRLLSHCLAPGFAASSWQAEKFITLEYRAEVKWRILLSFCLSMLRLIFHSYTAQYDLNIPYSQHFCPEWIQGPHPDPQLLAINSDFFLVPWQFWVYQKAFIPRVWQVLVPNTQSLQCYNEACLQCSVSSFASCIGIQFVVSFSFLDFHFFMCWERNHKCVPSPRLRMRWGCAEVRSKLAPQQMARACVSVSSWQPTFACWLLNSFIMHHQCVTTFPVSRCCFSVLSGYVAAGSTVWLDPNWWLI